MKKLQLLLTLTLASTCIFLASCGDSTETLNNNDTSIPEFEEFSGTLNTETPEDEDLITDEAPAEGMVRSDATNLWIDEEIAMQRPIAIMMPTDSAAQPQYGIGQASILYEIMEEGSISRQMAIIEDWQDLEKIGNVRSCRDYYLYAACEWDPILIHFGGVFYMTSRLEQGDIDNISGAAQDGTGPAPGSYAFFRTTDKSAPHNAYISGEGILGVMDSLGYEEEHRDEYYVSDHFTFAAVGTENTLSDYANAITCNTIDLTPVFPVSKSLLEYNAEDGLYYKFLHGEEQVEASTGEQLTFKNIIVQYTNWSYQADNVYLHFDMCDSGLGGYYITNGKSIPITWTKTGDYEPTKYYDMSGNEIEINTGTTYIAVAQNGTVPIIE